MARNFKKLKLILPAQLPGATKQKSNVLAALDMLKVSWICQGHLIVSPKTVMTVRV